MLARNSDFKRLARSSSALIRRPLANLLFEAEIHGAKLFLLVGERLRHAVEGVRELTELVPAANLDPRAAVSGSDTARRRRDALDRSHEYAGEQDHENDADRHDDDGDLDRRPLNLTDPAFHLAETERDFDRPNRFVRRRSARLEEVEVVPSSATDLALEPYRREEEEHGLASPNVAHLDRDLALGARSGRRGERADGFLGRGLNLWH